jgi:hypothetical protein
MRCRPVLGFRGFISGTAGTHDISGTADLTPLLHCTNMGFVLIVLQQITGIGCWNDINAHVHHLIVANHCALLDTQCARMSDIEGKVEEDVREGKSLKKLRQKNSARRALSPASSS